MVRVHTKMYLIVDAHSKWPEVFTMNINITTSVISCFREPMWCFGIPGQIITDNGRKFTTKDFEWLFKNNGIRHPTSSAYDSSTNGEAERFVQTFKNAMAYLKSDYEM